MKLAKLQRTIRKHDQLLTVLGALVIFLTFVVKEIYRDEAKDLGNALDSARSTFAIRGEIQEAVLNVNMVKSDVATLLTRGQRPGGIEPNDEAIQAGRKARLYETARLMQQWLDHVIELEKSMPDHSLHCASDARRTLDEAQKEVFSNVADAEERITKVDVDLPDCQDKLAGAVQSAEQKARAREARFGSLSVALFVLGWTLTLIGKLTKREKVEGTEANNRR